MPFLCRHITSDGIEFNFEECQRTLRQKHEECSYASACLYDAIEEMYGEEARVTAASYISERDSMKSFMSERGGSRNKIKRKMTRKKEIDRQC
eukprot:TRINITY_DN16507_c0_g1_i1.p1 TRINITY_DN16507_c0_g1~~TRINITY_DN16507_c0_g1_i1.p1  ORF type:complete len:93 (-),score=16.08 TRINITY_DN16507_c0_g1_i1:186-464(-)